MKIGVPKEIKSHEYRVGATPEMAGALKGKGHTILVQAGAGEKIGFKDSDYATAGAVIVANAAEVFEADMIVKVKELQKSEFELVKAGQIIFCYLHLAPDPDQTACLMSSGCIAIAYETVTDRNGKLALLEPMSEIAGRIAVQVGAVNLQLNHGGKGILLGGITGVRPGVVTIIGGGALGREAARMAMGLGADVTVLDVNLERLKTLDALYGPRLKTLYSTPQSVEESIIASDLVIGAVLLPGKMAPKLITRSMISKMTPGSVFVDPSIDQGGCSETSKPTTHDQPTYVVDGVVHYCVTNMPGACARTATLALTHVTAGYVQQIADLGCLGALQKDSGLLNGLNIYKGHVTNQAVATDLKLPFFEPKAFL